MSFGSRKRAIAKSTLICLALSALLFLVPSRYGETSRLAVASVFAPAQSGMIFISAPIASFFKRFAGMWRASGEVEKLRAENERLRAQLFQEAEKRHAAESQLAQIGLLPAEYAPHALPVAVSSFDSSPLRSGAVFNRGSRAGIVPNATVLWNGAVAGRVTAVSPWTCKAILVGDRKCAIAVRCSRSRAQGLLEGIGGGLSVVKYIPADADVNVGDLFVTTGADGLFPGGLLVGRCIKSSNDSGESFKDIIVKPAFEPSLLEHAAILMPDETMGHAEPGARR